jgi:hypothetical protein
MIEVPTGGRKRWKGAGNWTKQTPSLLFFFFYLLFK